MSHMKTEKLDIRVEPRTKKLLEDIADKNDISISDIIRLLIKNFVHLLKIGGTQ